MHEAYSFASFLSKEATQPSATAVPILHSSKYNTLPNMNVDMDEIIRMNKQDSDDEEEEIVEPVKKEKGKKKAEAQFS